MKNSKKLVAMAVALIMALTSFPAVFAVGETVTDEFYGWNFTEKAIRPSTKDEYKVDGAQAAVVSWDDDRVSFAAFTLPEGTEVPEGSSLKATFKLKAYNQNGNSEAENRIDSLAIFAVDPAAVTAKDNDLLTAARDGKTLVGKMNLKNVSNSWADVSCELLFPSDAVYGGKIGLLLSNREEIGADNGIATFKDAAVTDVNVMTNATVAAKVVDENGDPIDAFAPVTVDGLYAGKVYDGEGVDFGSYYLDEEGAALYKLIKPEAITLQGGENEYNVTAKLYKNVVGGNMISNPSFEDGLEGWTVTQDVPMSDVPGEFEIVDDPGKVSHGEKALWLKGVNGKMGTLVDTHWQVKPDTMYYAAFDVMGTKGTTSYTWFYTVNAESDKDTPDGNKKYTRTHYADDEDQMHINVINGSYLRKQYVITTSSTDDKLGFGGEYFGNDSAPIVDNFILYELADLETDVRYSVVASIDGTDDGAVGTVLKGEGTVGDVISVDEGQLPSARKGKTYYTNGAGEITLAKGVGTYYVEADKIAEITGTEKVTAVSVGDYEPLMPSSVMTTVDNGEFEPEAFDVAWDGMEGVLVDEKGESIGVTVTAENENLEKTFGLVDTTASRVQNNQARTKDVVVPFPKEIEDGFTAELQVVFDRNSDEQILFMDKDIITTNDDGTVGNKNVFAYAGIQIVCNSSGFCPRTPDDLQPAVAPIEVGKVYTLLFQADVTNQKYTLTVADEDGNVSISDEMSFRQAGNIDCLALVSNAGKEDGSFKAANIQINAPSVTDVPEAADLNVSLGFIPDGEKADTLTLNITADGAYAGQTLKIVAQDAHRPFPNKDGIANTLVDTITLEEGKNVVALIPSSANLTYSAYLVDSDSGYILDSVTAALSPLVADDIADNLAEYTSEGAKLNRIDKAVEALSAMGAVYGGDGKFGDSRDKFITVENVDDKTVITLDETLYKNGFGFKVKTKAGSGTPVDALSESLFHIITINADKTVTVAAADGALTLSLESVEIEFISTDIEESNAENVSEEYEFVNEL